MPEVNRSSVGFVPTNALVFTNITSTPEVAGDTEAIVSCHVDEWSAFRRSGARLLLKWSAKLLLEKAVGTDPNDAGGHQGDKKKVFGDGPEAVN